jgi:glutamine synthetase
VFAGKLTGVGGVVCSLQVVFNGNGYAESWPAEAAERGLFVIPGQPEAISVFTKPKNIALFEKQKIFSAVEVSPLVQVDAHTFLDPPSV